MLFLAGVVTNSSLEAIPRERWEILAAMPPSQSSTIASSVKTPRSLIPHYGRHREVWWYESRIRLREVMGMIIEAKLGLPRTMD